MKKITISLSISLVFTLCSAQARLTPGELKGKLGTFIIKKLDEPFDTTKHIVVYSKSNKYNNGVPYSKAEKDPQFLPMNPKKDTHVNNEAINQIVYSVLNKKLDALKRNKEQMNLIFDFEPDGKLTDISFGLNENTLITLQDIEEIDRQLRASIKATFTGKQYLRYIAISYYVPSITF